MKRDVVNQRFIGLKYECFCECINGWSRNDDAKRNAWLGKEKCMKQKKFRDKLNSLFVTFNVSCFG